ncbi:unnamed protein product [Rotaria sp. Silwood1]|nr:unnamed protein product [Rotaria sp. Silwood1]CAF1631496.1 unnamed protein product [Rotaria sp. Silwood1]CAF3753122.1 unnamed protein product [Rotaria sp. Silwood1]CAF3812438.1 unnamed protein product [Rotaria sp. Silwood1]CAF3835335.1 unnamed protein product [Rotaria sp. Silwood1]
MTEESIQAKYERLQATSSSSHNTPIPIVIHNFFSTKRFAATVSNSEQQNINDSTCTSEIIINDQTNILTNSKNESTVRGTTSENKKRSAFTIDEYDNPNKTDENHTFNKDFHLEQYHEEIIIQDDESSLDSDSNMTNNYEAQSNYNQPLVSLQSAVNILSNLSDNVITSIKGVRFINAHEMTFVQAHGVKYPHIAWNTNDNLPSVKPSPAWFSNEHPWLRAIRTGNQYGLLCIDCAEFASSITKHKNSDLHKTCADRRAASKIAAVNGSVAGQLQCVNLDIQTRKYLSILIQTLWKIIREEMPFSKFKPLIQFLYDVPCPDIVNCVEDAIENSMYDTYDTVHSTLVFLRDSPHRLQVLFESQKLTNSNKKEQTVPKSSETRWSYAYELLQFMCKHYTAIIITLSTISQYNANGSSDGRRFALDLMKPTVIFQIHLMRDALRPALKFLRQIEKRGSGLDEFSIHVDAARNTIKQVVEMFDFNQIRSILNDIQQYLPAIQPTFPSTRFQHQELSTDFDEEQCRAMGKTFINSFLQSLDDRFNAEAKQLIENIAILSSPFKYSAEQLLQNPLIAQYCSSMSYRHVAVNRQTYERTDPPLLNYQKLKDDAFAFLTIVGDVTSITAIVKRLAEHGSEQCSEWYNLFQILATFAVGSNEAERTFSTLRRIKSWLRNSLSDTTLEVLVKMSAMKVNLSDDAIQFIIEDFINNPQQAKRRNIKVFIDDNNDKERKLDEDFN